ncbi:MAG: hypothetical protein ACRDQW_09520 [Haloechinothrix sp.]
MRSPWRRKQVRIVTELPENAYGKVLKRELRGLFHLESWGAPATGHHVIDAAPTGQPPWLVRVGQERRAASPPGDIPA